MKVVNVTYTSTHNDEVLAHFGVIRETESHVAASPDTREKLHLETRGVEPEQIYFK